MQSRALREALSLAVDREALNEAVGIGGPVATSPIRPGVPGHDPTLASVFDPDEARRRLDQALDELGLGGPEELSLTFLHGTFVGDGPRYLEQQWREVLGVEVAFTGLEPPQYIELVGSKQHGYDMFWIAWIADYPHPAGLPRTTLGVRGGQQPVRVLRARAGRAAGGGGRDGR